LNIVLIIELVRQLANHGVLLCAIGKLSSFSVVPELVELSPYFGGVCIRHRTQPGVLKSLNSHEARLLFENEELN
jgi:hypothetical protein